MALGNATAGDVCDAAPAVSNDAPAIFPLGTTTVTWTATDGSANSSSASQSVTVVDTTPPSISCPAPITAECTGAGSAPATPANATGDDVCTEVSLTEPASASFPLGTTELTYIATDGVGLTASCTSSVEVVDTTPPSISRPTAITAECTGNSSATVTPGTASGVDVCAGVSVSGHAEASFLLGVTSLTYVATDEVGLQTSCASSIEVTDTTPPSITCPAAITAECTGNGSATVTPGAASGADVCAGVSVSGHGEASFPLGPTSLTYVATDDVGLQNSCVSAVEVVDTTPPSVVCPAPIVAECTGDHSATVTPGAATAADICRGVTVSAHATGSFALGTTTLPYAATDEAGLQSSCTSAVSVVDTSAPSISSLVPNPDSLWPPNHKMQSVQVQVISADGCDPVAPTCEITAITSTEPQSVNNGDKSPDWQITGALSADLRAERLGNGAGRIYTLTVTCTDLAGNSTTQDAEVTVPHDQGKKK